MMVRSGLPGRITMDSSVMAQVRIVPIQSRSFILGEVQVFSGIIGISSGSYHTVYLKSDGTVWAAGRNNFGQLGDGTTPIG